MAVYFSYLQHFSRLRLLLMFNLINENKEDNEKDNEEEKGCVDEKGVEKADEINSRMCYEMI